MNARRATGEKSSRCSATSPSSVKESEGDIKEFLDTLIAGDVPSVSSRPCGSIAGLSGLHARVSIKRVNEDIRV
jgi:hypothetical protein